MPSTTTKTVTLADIHRLLKGSYPTQWNPDVDYACKETLKQLAEQYGIERVELGVMAYKRAGDAEKFFQPDRIEKYIPPRQRQK